MIIKLFTFSNSEAIQEFNWNSKVQLFKDEAITKIQSQTAQIWLYLFNLS